MYSVIVILMVVAAVLMCFIVLIQESKGGGLASGFRKGNMDIGHSIGCFQCSFCIFRSFS